jgi:hypothetical protein
MWKRFAGSVLHFLKHEVSTIPIEYAVTLVLLAVICVLSIRAIAKDPNTT